MSKASPSASGTHTFHKPPALPRLTSVHCYVRLNNSQHLALKLAHCRQSNYNKVYYCFGTLEWNGVFKRWTCHIAWQLLRSWLIHLLRLAGSLCLAKATPCLGVSRVWSLVIHLSHANFLSMCQFREDPESSTNTSSNTGYARLAKKGCLIKVAFQIVVKDPNRHWSRRRPQPCDRHQAALAISRIEAGKIEVGNSS